MKERRSTKNQANSNQNAFRKSYNGSPVDKGTYRDIQSMANLDKSPFNGIRAKTASLNFNFTKLVDEHNQKSTENICDLQDSAIDI
jgi:hypothetical protein